MPLPLLRLADSADVVHRPPEELADERRLYGVGRTGTNMPRRFATIDLVEEKSDVIHAVYERIVIEGPRFVGLRLTPAHTGADRR